MAQIAIEQAERHTKSAPVRRLTDTEIEQWLNAYCKTMNVSKEEIAIWLESA